MSTPQSKPIPRFKAPRLLGSVMEFMDIRKRLDLLLRVCQECGDVGQLRLGPVSLYVINSPALLSSLLVDHANEMHTDAFYRTIWPVMGRTSLVSVTGDYHRRLRRIMAPAFTPKRLQNYGRDMVTEAERFVRDLKGGGEVEIVREMQKVIRNILMKSVFAVDLSEQDSFFQSVQVISDYIGDGVGNFLRPPLWFPLPSNRKASEAINHVRGRAQQLLEQAKVRGQDKGDVLSMLLMAKDEDGSGLSDAELLDQVVTLYLAGFESTANTLALTMRLLAMHPDVYARLQSEVDTVLGGRVPTVEDLPKLTYLQQVTKEALRVYPAGTIFARCPRNDMNVLGYDFPKDAFLAICPYVIHRNPEYFPDPERFLPERFSPENEKKLPRNAYIPFGTGPKVCIGQHLAMMEIQMVLAYLCQHISISLPANFKDTEVLPQATLTPTPFKLVMTPRPPSALAMVS